MIIIIAGKTVKGPVTVTVPADEQETAHSVAVSRAPSGA